MEARIKRVPVLRHLFDEYIYPHVSREELEKAMRGRDKSLVQVADHGTDEIKVRIKTEGATEKIG